MIPASSVVLSISTIAGSEFTPARAEKGAPLGTTGPRHGFLFVT